MHFQAEHEVKFWSIFVVGGAVYKRGSGYFSSFRLSFEGGE